MTATVWWQRGIIYQVYPRSFQDSGGDGIGDLPGITRRLDHLAWLGVDAVWLSPIYPSPMADFGYDVSDYCAVAPIFGTLADFDRLAAEAHARGLRLILDFVPNHTSDQHPWFLESRSARASPWRDWYIWRDPAPGGGPPNNWLSHFGGGAWAALGLDPRRDLDPQLAAADPAAIRALASPPTSRWRARPAPCRRSATRPDPARANASTARDMTALLSAIWTDAAAPPSACGFVRAIMGEQVSTQRRRGGRVGLRRRRRGGGQDRHPAVDPQRGGGRHLPRRPALRLRGVHARRLAG